MTRVLKKKKKRENEKPPCEMKVHNYTDSIRGAKRLRIVAPKPKAVEPYTGKRR